MHVEKIYEPPSGDVAPPLPAAMTEPLPLNFGDAGVPLPLTFKVPEGQSTDVGFVRIFISTRNANLSGIAQKPVVERGLAKGIVSPCNWTSEPEMWDAITIPVVMK